MYNFQSFNPHSIRQKPFSENAEKIKWYEENERNDVLIKRDEKTKKKIEDNER